MTRIIAQAPTTEQLEHELIADGWEPEGDGVLGHGGSAAFIVMRDGWAKAYIALCNETQRSRVLIEEGIHRRRLSERGA